QICGKCSLLCIAVDDQVIFHYFERNYYLKLSELSYG
ncbi:MAG: hypothetical protein ACI81W_001921, partial [Saprospiraceae bacterium]